MKKMDALDASLFVLAAISGFILVDVASFDLFGVNFGETVTTVSGIKLSSAWLLGYGAIVGTILTNENARIGSLASDMQSLDQWYYFAALATLALPIAFVAFPDTVGSFFKSEDLWGLGYVVTITIGQFSLGWLL